MQNERIGWIDDLRGFALCAMILYHAVFNLMNILYVPLPWLSRLWGSTFLDVVQTLFVLIFLLLAGICTQFTRHPFRRAAKVAIGALLVTVATSITVPDNKIVWGILHLMAFCMFFYAVFEKVFLRISPRLSIVLCLLLFAVTFGVSDGYIGLGALRFTIPAQLYKNDLRLIFGLSSPTFQSFDYVPIFPYFFFFLCGSFLSRLSLPKWKSHSRFFTYIGKHSLFVYLLHQPVLWGIIWIMERCMP